MQDNRLRKRESRVVRWETLRIIFRNFQATVLEGEIIVNCIRDHGARESSTPIMCSGYLSTRNLNTNKESTLRGIVARTFVRGAVYALRAVLFRRVIRREICRLDILGQEAILSTTDNNL